MREHSADLAGVVTGGGFARELYADVYYGSERILADVPLSEWALEGDYDGKVKTAASCTVTYQGDFADSVTPREVTDALAPFGQELRLYMWIRNGSFSERLPMGAYRINEVPNARDETATIDSNKLTIGSVVELTLLDRLSTVDTLSRSLDKPASLTSAWAEIARISRLPVSRTVPDAAIPYSVVYARNRLDTVQQLAGILGGRAFMLANGTLGVIPDELGTPVLDLKTGEPDGTIIGAGYFMESKDIANVVIGDFEDANGKPIRAEKAITSGPLDVAGPFLERVVEYPSDQKQFVKTQAEADAAVAAYLAKVSRRGPYEIPVTLVPDPRLEIGDVINLQRPEGMITGRVVKYSHPRKGAMQITVRAGG